MTETKQCEVCSARYRRPPNYGPKKWAGRRYCSHDCARVARHVSLADRFEALVIRDPDPAGHWYWQGAPNEDGYGKIKVGGAENGYVLAHVAAYELYIGPIPHGLVIDHTCRLHICVAPHHLEAVTSAINTRRGAKAKLTAEQVRMIRLLVAAGYSHGDVAQQFGVCRRNISYIIAGRIWSDTHALIPRVHHIEVAA